MQVHKPQQPARKNKQQQHRTVSVACPEEHSPLAIEMAGVEHDDLEGSKTSDRGELALVLAPVHRSRRRRHPVCSEIEGDGRATH